MPVETCASAQSFLEETEAYRGAEPLGTNVLGSVALTVADGSRSYESCRWWVVRDDHGDVVGAAMRTAPHAVCLGPMPEECAASLGAAAAVSDDDLAGASGPVGEVRAFLDAYVASGSPGSRRALGPASSHLLYEVHTLRRPEVPGTASAATLEEIERAVAWYAAFSEEIDGSGAAPAQRASIEATVRAGRLWWWLDDRGEVVSMAGHAVATPTPAGMVVRVGPVYTPPRARRRGFGAAVTAAVTERHLADGSRVMLFTDAANATSNGVYRGIGYELVGAHEVRLFSS